LSSRRVEPKRQRAFHRHNEVELLLIEKGGIDHLMGGRLERFRPGKLVVFWGAIPHAPLHIGPGTVLHRLTLPLAWFLEWKLPRPFTQSILSGEVVADRPADGGAADLAMFGRWNEDLRNGSADRCRLVLLECEARLRRLLLSAALGERMRQPAAEAVSRGSSQVERMSRFVALHYSEELRIADIAHDAGLNPDYAATLFRKTCGLSLVDYVNEHRISHSQRLLATSDAKIVDIAFIAGFGSASRFYTAFKQACGMTPRRYRKRMSADGG
jgi:AraC-like DNA-binding protein